MSRGGEGGSFWRSAAEASGSSDLLLALITVLLTMHCGPQRAASSPQVGSADTHSRTALYGRGCSTDTLLTAAGGVGRPGPGSAGWC